MEHEYLNNAVPTIEYFKHRAGTPEWLIEYKRTNFIDITYIINGQAVYTINREKITVSEGDVLCIPRGSERSAASTEPKRFECYAANFTMHSYGSDNEEIGNELALPLPIHATVGIHNDLIAHYRKLNEDFLSRSPGYVMRARARLMLIIQRFMEILVYERDTHRLDPRVKQAMRYIAENYAEPLTISGVAAVVSLNAVYFGTLFKRETSLTFRDYLNNVRLGQAEEMLRAGKWNVTEVSTLCGFSDVFYFSRLFKKYKGIPPSSVK